MMSKVVISEAAKQGEKVVITRCGEQIAQPVQSEKGVDGAKGVAAVRRIMALRKSVTLGVGTSLKELIDEGRR